MIKLQAYAGDKPFIFVSYAHNDKDKVYPFIAELQKKYNVWFDEGIPYTAEYRQVLASRLKNCSLFLYMVTADSLESKWCRKEIAFAVKHDKPFINILMEKFELPDWFAFDFGVYQYFPYYEFTSPESAAADLERKCGLLDVANNEKSPAADPAPEETSYAESEAVEQPDFSYNQDLPVICRSTGPETCEVIGVKNGNFTGVLEIPERIGDKTVTSIRFDIDWVFSGLTGLIVPDTLEYAEGLPRREVDYCEINYREYGNGLYIGSRSNPYMILMEAVDEDSEVSIHPDAKIIYDFSLEDCSFTSITIPPSVKRIGYAALPDSLRNIFISDLPKWCEVDIEKSAGQPGVFSDNKKNNCIYLNGMLLEDLVIPDGVKTINDYVFAGCSSITTVTIPSSVERIGRGAFENCSGLTKVSVAGNCGVLTIETYAFASCGSLTQFTIEHIPDKNRTQEDDDYDFSKAIQALAYFKSRTNGSFEYTSKTAISDMAFANCYSLVFINLQTIISEIGKDAFMGCWKLKNIIFAGTRSQWRKTPKNKEWNYGTNNFTVHCNDGKIKSRGLFSF